MKSLSRLAAALLLLALPASAQQHVVWQFPVPEVALRPAVSSDGTVYVLSPQGVLSAVSTEGVVRWQFEAGEASGGGPVLGPEGNVYFTTQNRLFAINGSTGQRLWDQAIEGGTHYGPVVAGNGVVGTAAGETDFQAFTAQGAPAWSFSTDFPISAQPAAGSDGTFFLPENEGVLVGVREGQKTASNETLGSAAGPPFIGTNGMVTIANRDAQLFLLDPTGAEVWNQEPSFRFTTPPVLGPDGTVYIAGDDGDLHAFAKADGTESVLATQVQAIGSIQVLPQGLLLTTSDNRVLLVDFAGKVQRSYQASGGVAAAVQGPGDLLYAVIGHSGGVNMLSAISSEPLPSTAWTASGLQNLAVYKLLQHPDNARILYAGTKDGLYRSDDAGATWNPAGLSGGLVGTTAFDVAKGGAGWALVDDIIATSPDTINWSLNQRLQSMDLLSADLNNPQRAVAGSHETGLITETTNGSTSYTDFDPTVTGLRQVLITGKGDVLAVTADGIVKPADGTVVLPGEWTYVHAQPDRLALYALGVNKLALSGDGGATWETVNTLLPGTLWRLAVEPSNPSILYAATAVPQTTQTVTSVQGINLYRSEDGGRTWMLFNRGLEDLNVHTLISDGDGSLLLGNDRGVWRYPIGTAPPPPPPPPPGGVRGDLSGNGKLDVLDALAALKIAVGLSPAPTGNQLTLGDVAPLGAPDGRINVQDAIAILRAVVGLIPPF